MCQNTSFFFIIFCPFNSLTQCRGGGGSDRDGGSSSRVVNQLLTEMDGVQVRTGVFLMAATNRPDILGEIKILKTNLQISEFKIFLAGHFFLL